MDIAITKGIYDKMVSEKFVVSMMGLFDQDLLLSLMTVTDKKLSGLDVQRSIKKRIFHFMVECSENLLNIEKNSNHTHNNIFLIGQDGDQYNVYLGSAVSNDHLAPVLTIIDQVNTIGIEEVKKKYLNELSHGESNESSLLLLNMLNISKKTKRKIEYEVTGINGQTSFLSFKIAMNNES